MESENGKDSGMQTAAAGTSRDDSYPAIRVGASHSSSSSSSSAADADKDGAISDDSLSKSGLMSPEEAAAAAGQTPQWSMVSVSPRSGPGPMSSAKYSPHYDWGKLPPSPRQSPPPMQTMGRTSEEGGGAGAGYDPYRIPSAVFSSKPATPMEWSVASNESLFSIHMGNNSFSRDNAILKSGELTKSGELMINFNKSGQPPAAESNSDELNKSPSSLPTVIKAPDDKSGLPAPAATPVKETAELDHNNSSSKNPAVQHSLSKASDGTRTSANTPRLSDGSGNSSHSFAFPILMGEEGTNVSVKVPPTNDLQANPSDKKAATAAAEQQQPPAEEAGQAAAGTPKAPNETKWFSCFSCRFPCF